MNAYFLSDLDIFLIRNLPSRKPLCLFIPPPLGFEVINKGRGRDTKVFVENYVNRYKDKSLLEPKL